MTHFAVFYLYLLLLLSFSVESVHSFLLPGFTTTPTNCFPSTTKKKSFSIRSGKNKQAGRRQGLLVYTRVSTGTPSFLSSTLSPSSFSAGASSSSSFDWTAEWYPILPVQDLCIETPNKITLLGKDFVVWFHEATNSWRAFADACPHRLVPLSEGRLDGDGIQCAYRTFS